MRDSEEIEREKQAVEKLVDDIERLFPNVEKVISGSDFGQDAVKKARSVLERAKDATDARDRQAMSEAKESLNRTLNMFRGVVSKTRMS